MFDAEQAAKTEAAKAMQLAIDWDKFPRLAQVFKNRPPQNVYWLELVELVRQFR